MTSQLLVLDTRGIGFSPSTLEVADAVVDALGDAASAGAAAGTGVAASEGIAFTKRTELTLTDVEITMTDATTAGCHGGLKIYDFPEGLISVKGTVSDLAIVAGSGGISDTAAVVGSIGSAVAGNNNDTLTSTEANFMPSTAATLTDGAGNCNGESTAVATLDGTATAVDMYLNFAIPDAGSSGNDTLTVNGTVVFEWSLIGDN